MIECGPYNPVRDNAINTLAGRAPISYLGTWRFGVRDRADVVQTLALKDPSLDMKDVATALPDPPQVQARLFEVMPYPRVPRYFRRHWW